MKSAQKSYETDKAYFRKWSRDSSGNCDLKIYDLMNYPEETLGFELGRFLISNKFEMQKRPETHDIFHVLTNIGVTVEEEIGMQFYLFGNGKRSSDQFIIMLSGIICCPSHAKTFINYYRKGKEALHFHNLEFMRMLPQPVKKIRETFLIR